MPPAKCPVRVKRRMWAIWRSRIAGPRRIWAWDLGYVGETALSEDAGSVLYRTRFASGCLVPQSREDAPAQVICAVDDKIEYGLCIAGDADIAFSTSMVAADARSARRTRCCAGLVRPTSFHCQRRVAFLPQFRVGALNFGDRVVLRRGHWPSPRRAPCRSAIGMHLARVKIVAMFPPGRPEP